MSIVATIDPAELTARHVIARALAAALAPPDPARDRAARSLDEGTLSAAWSLIEAADAGRPDLPTAPELKRTALEHSPGCAALLVPWFSLPARTRREAYQQVFGLVIAQHCPLCETEYMRSGDAFARAQAMADIAGFYRAFGVQPDARVSQRPDHVSIELDFLALLYTHWADESTPDEARETVQSAHSAFLQDHLSIWIPAMSRLLEQRAATAGQSAPPETRVAIRLMENIGRLIGWWIASECRFAGVRPPSSSLPVLAREDDEAEAACPACDAP
ncbi:MAG: molecular chaperone TorD family protein [Phycisphaerales bacterium]|nr:molecular chaperone TorD family protein [Phycisphaerales bacterium]